MVWNAVKVAGVKDAGRQVAIYRDAAGGLVDVEVGVEVGSAFVGRDAVVGSEMPAGETATVTHLGPYWKLSDAHRAIAQWCAAEGRAVEGTRWEIYGHWVSEWNNDASKIRTDVFYLLKS